MAFTVPPGLEKLSFTGVAEAGGRSEWLPQPTSEINTVNVFVFDKVNQKVGYVAAIGLGHSVGLSFGRSYRLVRYYFLGRKRDSALVV
jgi:hypothetical protein